MSLAHNDPSELLEVFDPYGRPTGQMKSRAEVHLDGDWHQAFHCWIVRRGGSEVVLQRRSLVKDTFAGLWDATAAGHWRFGESAAEASREIAEELGLEVAFDRLLYRGREVSARAFPNGLIDREHHQVYVLQSDLALDCYRPDPGEVSGLAAFRSTELVALLEGSRTTTVASEALEVPSQGSLLPCRVEIEARDVVPYSGARIRGMLGGLYVFPTM